MLHSKPRLSLLRVTLHARVLPLILWAQLLQPVQHMLRWTQRVLLGILSRLLLLMLVPLLLLHEEYFLSLLAGVI